MKSYALLTLVATAVFLLIPLGALPKPAAPPVAKESAEKAVGTGGVFRVRDPQTGEVSEWTERDFLIGTVSCEMSPSAPTEALKAQAVASFTYYAAQRAAARASDKEADFDDVPTRFPEGYTEKGMRERWGDAYAENYHAVAAAVDAVAGEMLLYDGKPIRAVYHDISAGATEAAVHVWGTDYPYLQSVPSPGDTEAKDYRTTVTVKADEFAKKAKTLGLSSSSKPADWLGDTAKTDAGLVTGITVMGQTVTGAQMRRAFGLRSAFFNLTYQDDRFTFTVLGHGHGVGMSQAGAVHMAKQGAGYREILGYYYSGITFGESAGTA